MASMTTGVLSEKEMTEIHEASLMILAHTGILVHHVEMLSLLEQHGAIVNPHTRIAKLPERLVVDGITRATKQYILYGRDPRQTARFGYGDRVWMSSPGQYAWIDLETGRRRPATLTDARDAIRLGHVLENIAVVGSLAQPQEIAETYRDVVLTAELVKGTTKPTRCWIKNGKTARYVLEIYRAVAGGSAALRERPMVEAFLEPISPLQLPGDGLDIVAEFARAGQPVSVGPMAMASGTAPATLAGTLAQENAEILAGVVMTQVVAPGTAMTYGGIPHIMDPRTSICSFGAPEQGLMAVAMVQLARSYGFPVYVNTGLTDAKIPDVQAGMEKGCSLLLSVLAGADTFGHCGICGTDHAGSLLWLYMDNELGHYVQRILDGFEVNPDTLATGLIHQVGPGGHFLAEQHTVDHFRKELWLSGPTWTRQSFDAWENQGGLSWADRARREVRSLLDANEVEPIDPALACEIDRIVACAQQELG